MAPSIKSRFLAQVSNQWRIHFIGRKDFEVEEIVSTWSESMAYMTSLIFNGSTGSSDTEQFHLTKVSVFGQDNFIKTCIDNCA